MNGLQRTWAVADFLDRPGLETLRVEEKVDMAKDCKRGQLVGRREAVRECSERVKATGYSLLGGIVQVGACYSLEMTGFIGSRWLSIDKALPVGIV